MKRRIKVVPAAFLLYVRDLSRTDRAVLMLRRKNTGHEDGNWGLPSGHLEAGETPLLAALREGSSEEVHGVRVLGETRLVHTQFNRSSNRSRSDYLNLYFVPQSWMGEPVIGEPDQCEELCWMRLSESERDYPKDVISYIRTALACFAKKVIYSETDYSPKKNEHP